MTTLRPPAGQQWFHVADLARMFEVKPSTVRRWAEGHVIDAVKVGPGQRSEWRFTPAAVEKFIEQGANGCDVEALLEHIATLGFGGKDE